MPTSSPVHGEPALSGGVGVGAWVPPDDGEGMHVHVDSVTAVAGAGDGARSGVSGLDSGQVRLGEGVDRDRAVLSAAHGASAWPGAGHGVAAGRDLLGPASQNAGVDSDDVDDGEGMDLDSPPTGQDSGPTLPPLSRRQRRARLLRNKKRQHHPSPSQ